MKPLVLSNILKGLSDTVEKELNISSAAFHHGPTKGEASENVWLSMLNTYLPKRYRVDRAHVVDSDGTFSDQIDVVIFDRQYSPFIFSFKGQTIVPAESVYAVLEAKQTIDSRLIMYAQDKIASVRRLNRTSLPIPHATGTAPPKEPPYILGGILALKSQWKPPLGKSLTKALESDSARRLDLGCVATAGVFSCDDKGCISATTQRHPATAFLFDLIARLQSSGTVGMMNIGAYARWLK